MPVKILHRRYLVFKRDEKVSPKSIFEIYKQLYGVIQFSLSGLSLIESINDILIYSIGSRYVSSLVAAATYYSIKNKCELCLLNICTTIKECKSKNL